MVDTGHTTGHVVEEFYIGPTHVRICDDYCRGKTREDVQAILDRIAEITIGPLTVAAEAKERERLKAKSAAKESEN